MKLPVLKKSFAEKYVIKITAGVLTVALFAGGLTGAAAQTGQKETQETKTEAASETFDDGEEEDLSELISLEKDEREIEKEENVYLLAAADGKVYETIVTNHLYNRGEKETLVDCSELSDIENTAGDETFEKDGNKLTWQAKGSDICYSGTAKKEAPVSQKVTYYLDGKEIAPAQLAGKSGKVTIRFDYENRSSYTAKVNGGNVTVKVPFAAVTTLVLDERFSHVKVENGRLESNGERMMAVGYALPGMRESLNVTDSDFAGELNLPEYFAVTAEVENFELDTAMTIVVNAGEMISMKKGDGSALDDMMEELTDAVGRLRGGSSELADGMDALRSSLADYTSGMNELYRGSGDLAKGAQTLNESAAVISQGIEKLDAALGKPMSEEEQEAVRSAAASAVEQEFENGKTKEAADQIYGALRYAKGEGDIAGDGELYQALYDGAYSANASAAVYGEVVRNVLLAAAGQPADSGLSAEEAASAVRQQFGAAAQAGDTAAAAMYGVTEGMTAAQLAELLYAKTGAGDTLFGKTESTLAAQLAAGRNNGQIEAAVEQSLAELASELALACRQSAVQAAGAAAVSGAESAKQKVAGQIEAVNDSGYSLVTGAAALSRGTQSLADQIPALTEGITALNNAAGQLADGVGRLSDGSRELEAGMVEFDEEGISRIVNSYNGDLKPLTDRLQAVLDAGKDYQSFSGAAEGAKGSVKFVCRLDAVKAE